MWGRKEKLNGRIRTRASRWPRSQLVLQVEADVFELVLDEKKDLQEQQMGTRWRDASVADLNDIGYLTTDREQTGVPAAQLIGKL